MCEIFNLMSFILISKLVLHAGVCLLKIWSMKG